MCRPSAIHRATAVKVCETNQCGHWVKCRSGHGCELNPKGPCRHDNHLLDGGGCLDTPQLFLPMVKQVEPVERDDHWYRATQRKVLVTIKPTQYRPRKPLAICTVIVGENARELSRITLPLMANYAKRVDADLVVIDQDQVPDYPIANKFQVQHVAEAYDRTLFIDIDIWIRDECSQHVCRVLRPARSGFTTTDRTTESSTQRGKLASTKPLHPINKWRRKLKGAGILASSYAIAITPRYGSHQSFH